MNKIVKSILFRAIIISTIISEAIAIFLILFLPLEGGDYVITSGGLIFFYLFAALLAGLIYPNVIIFLILFLCYYFKSEKGMIPLKKFDVSFFNPMNLKKTIRKYKVEIERKQRKKELERKKKAKAEREILKKKYLSFIKERKEFDRRYVCDKCDYKWESKKSFGGPSICPNCRGRFISKYSNSKEWLREQPNIGEFKDYSGG